MPDTTKDDELLSDEELEKYLVRNYSVSNGEANHLAQFIKQREEQVALKASMKTQFFLMSDLLLEMAPLLVHRYQHGFPEMTAEIIGNVSKWRNDKFLEAVKVVVPEKYEESIKAMENK